MSEHVLHFVDGDTRSRADLARTALALGFHTEVYANLEELCAHRPDRGILLIRDSSDLGGFREALELVGRCGVWLPVIAMGGEPATGQVVEAIKAGALDYIELPVEVDRLADMLDRIRDEASIRGTLQRRAGYAKIQLESLTEREREVLDLLAQGSSNKTIARELQISPRTVEIHRANMMAKLEASHVAEVIRLRLEASL